MNAHQKKVLIVGSILMCLMVLFPPWIQTYSYQSSNTKVAIGFYPLYEPPRPGSSDARFGMVVDSTRLAAELLVAGIVMGIVFMMLKDVKKETTT